MRQVLRTRRFTPLYSEHNPYSPPSADVEEEPEPAPLPVQRALTALWAAYALDFMHALTVMGPRWPLLPLELFFALLIYGVAQGRYLARLLYAVMLGGETVIFIREPHGDWQGSSALLVLTLVTFALQYLAMIWCFTKPGRSWFLRGAFGRPPPA